MNLEDLERGNIANPQKKPVVKQVRPDDMAPREEKEIPGQYMRNKLMGDLDRAIERDKKEMMANVIQPVLDKVEEKEVFGEEGEDAYFDRDITDPLADSAAIKSVTSNAAVNLEIAPSIHDLLEDDDDSSIPVSTTPTIVQPDTIIEEKNTRSFNDILENDEPDVKITSVSTSDDDISELLYTGDDVEDKTEYDDMTNRRLALGYAVCTDDKTEEEYSNSINQKIIPFSNQVNFADFKVSKKPLSTSKVLKAISSTEVRYANWIYRYAKKPFTMSEFKGSEIEKLNLEMSSDSSTNDFLKKQREAANIFYKHIIDKNKPATLEGWMKTMYYNDLLDLYFGAYRASFSNSTNYIPYTCAKCKHTFMELHPLADMVKFDTDDTKKEVSELLGKDTTSSGNIEGSMLCQISDNIAVSINMQTLYTMLVEFPVLPAKLIDNYNDMVLIISQIEDIYIIDHETHELKVVDTKPVPNDIAKTVKNKYLVYFDIINSLTSDQFDHLNFIIRKFNKDMDTDFPTKIKYVKPAGTCTKCKEVIGEIETDPVFLLFLRHRLQTRPLLFERPTT